MNGLEINKFAAAVLIAGIIAMVVGNVADILYEPDKQFQTGYHVDTGASHEVSSHGAEAPAAPINIAELMSKASAELGQKDAKKCTVCHSLEKNGPNRVGPHLWGIVGRDKASAAGFNYSDAIKSKGGKWTYEDLFAMISSPRKFAPGTKMVFVGYKNPEDAANTVAFLRTLSDNPAPLPK